MAVERFLCVILARVGLGGGVAHRHELAGADRIAD